MSPEEKPFTETVVITREKIRQVKSLIEAAELSLKNAGSAFAPADISVPSCDPRGCIIGCKSNVNG